MKRAVFWSQSHDDREWSRSNGRRNISGLFKFVDEDGE